MIKCGPITQFTKYGRETTIHTYSINANVGLDCSSWEGQSIEPIGPSEPAEASLRELRN
jgi:hypothetical protein